MENSPGSQPPFSQASSAGTALHANPHLVATKLLAPLAPPNLVVRLRISDRLAEGLQRKLTLVTGPADAGKTTALSELFGKTDLGETIASWLSLDEGDNDSLTFWDAFITALSENGGLGAGALSVLRFPEGAPIESVLTALINEVAQAPKKTVIVLDDLIVIEDPAIHRVLDEEIEHMPPHMHLMISSRQEPPLSLSRLRARGQLTELSATHLRFTEEEATGFLNDSMGLALASNQILTLAERTEGWIAGLQMAALSIRDRDPDRFIAAFTGSNRYVGDYLTEEVAGWIVSPAHFATPSQDVRTQRSSSDA